MPEISVIIPIYNEEKYIENCLDSIVSSEYDKEKIEVFLVDGGSSDRTLEIIERYRKSYPFLKLLHNPKKIVPVAMNLGIGKSSGEYIVRLDAHADYPRDYFLKLIKFHEELEADNVGGVIVTKVKNENSVSNAIRNVLSDKWGVGSTFRSGTRTITEVDTVPFGCYRREVFDRIGQYDERLVRNQDIELNKRLKRAGGKIYLVPDIACTYYARETYRELAKNSFDNGRWNILTAYYTGTLRSLSLRHYIPLLFILSLLVPFLCCPRLSSGIFLLYLSMMSIRSFQIRSGTTFLHQFLAFVVLHFSYGVGELAGMAEVLKNIFKGSVWISKR